MSKETKDCKSENKVSQTPAAFVDDTQGSVYRINPRCFEYRVRIRTAVQSHFKSIVKLGHNRIGF